MNPEGRDETYERACDALSALTEAALAFDEVSGRGREALERAALAYSRAHRKHIEAAVNISKTR